MPSDSLQVPSGNPPTIDGTHSPGEWDAAAVETFVDGSQLLLMQAGDSLYLGIRANVSGTVVGNVYILHGDEVAVLHSSAALGTAIYEKGEESWQQIQDFDWCCRTAGTSESAQAERAAFLQEEGWLAANGRMGTPNELEYQIKPAEPNVRLAVVYTGPTPPYEKVPWPVHVDDDTILPTPGGLPAFLHFSPEQWATLSIPALAPAETKNTAPGMLAFTSARDGNMEIYLMDVDGIPAWRPEIAGALPP